MSKIKAILVWALVLAPTAVAGAEPFAVVGWPVPELNGEAPGPSQGDDAVIGRQICPALSRLNITLKKSEELLLKRASYEHASSGHAVAFRYELRPGLFWWSGQGVSGEDLAAFLRAQLKPLVAERSAGLWSVPDFEVRVDGPLAASIHFKEEPAFGPFVFNGWSFYRRATGVEKPSFQFECVGLYRPTRQAYGLLLVPSEGYKTTQGLPPVAMYRSQERPAALPSRHLELRYASTIVSSPELRPSDKGAGCARTFELPQVAMIVWNTDRGFMADPAVRRAVSSLIPRAALVAAGAAQLAEAASSPVPREHPGYSPASSVSGFNLRAVSAALNRLGYRRKTAGSPRLSPKGEPLKLTLMTAGPSPNLLEKVLADTFAAAGISLVFKVRSSPDDDRGADGTLDTFAIDWPRVNLLGNFHPQRKGDGPFKPLHDPELEQQLERYALSLTVMTPDFAALKQVQKRLLDLEPVTVLFRQKACLDVGAAVRLPSGSINQRDPDWFRRLLL